MLLVLRTTASEDAAVLCVGNLVARSVAMCCKAARDEMGAPVTVVVVVV